MGYLNTPGTFERDINRGVLSSRSPRLNALVGAIAAYINNPLVQQLSAVEDALNAWKRQDPKEFADRGAKTEVQLRHEIGMKGAEDWGTGEPRVVDRLSHPDFAPARWNDNSVVQFSTNCYAYACNDPWDHQARNKPQPGQLAGVAVGEVEESVVRYAVMLDDQMRHRLQLQRLIPVVRLRGEAAPDVVNVPGYYLIALVTAPQADYHWLRQDRNGMWSHKPGWDPATNRDSAGKVIPDPREAYLLIGKARYEFNTFYYAPRGGVRTGDLGTLPARRASF